MNKINKKDATQDYIIKQANTKITMISSYKDPDVYKQIVMPGKTRSQRTIDYDKLAKKDFMINIIITGRGFGKTYRLKEFMAREFIERGRPSAWIHNTGVMWDTHWREFLTLNISGNPDLWANTKITRSGVYYVDEETKTETLMIRFIALSQCESYKINRQDVYYIGWDEMNVSIKTIKADMRRLINVVDKTYFRASKSEPAQHFWFCNQGSLRLDLFKNMNVDFLAIKYSYSAWVHETMGNLYCLLVPKKTLEELKAEAETAQQNKWILVTAILGQTDDTYLNENFFDNNWGLLPKYKFIKKNWRTNNEHLKIKDNYYKLYISNEGKWYFEQVVEAPESKGDICYFRIVDKEMGCIYNKFIRDEILSRIFGSQILFDSINTKLNIFEAIR